MYDANYHLKTFMRHYNRICSLDRYSSEQDIKNFIRRIQNIERFLSVLPIGEYKGKNILFICPYPIARELFMAIVGNPHRVKKLYPYYVSNISELNDKWWGKSEKTMSDDSESVDSTTGIMSIREELLFIIGNHELKGAHGPRVVDSLLSMREGLRNKEMNTGVVFIQGRFADVVESDYYYPIMQKFLSPYNTKYLIVDMAEYRENGEWNIDRVRRYAVKQKRSKNESVAAAFADNPVIPPNPYTKFKETVGKVDMGNYGYSDDLEIRT